MTTSPSSDFLATLVHRGYIHQASDMGGIDALAAKGELTTYVGYDCTAPSLHIGSLVSMMMLHWLQQTGNAPVVLMGAGTTLVGDPSGRDEARQILTPETIDANKAGIRRNFARLIRFTEDGGNARMVDNSEWLTKLNYIDFLRDVGRFFSVNRMLSMDSVRMRLEREQELSFLEFNYMCLQSYDFAELNRLYGVRMQMGGSDQWGNIVMGIDLGRRMGTSQLYGLTCPLMTTASGVKMGKTASGAVWLDPAMRSPWDYWQFWRNTEDADVERFLKLFTLLPLDEIARLAALAGAEINEAKKVLATEATTIIHGREEAERAAETARQTFEAGGTSTDLPSIAVPRLEIEAGLGLLAAFVRCGLVPSTGEARRQVKGGGLRLNDVVVTNERAVLTEADLVLDGAAKLSFGRKKHVLLRGA